MGTIKIVSNADYASNFIGKLDSKTKVFRRKIGTSLERNYIEQLRCYQTYSKPLNFESGIVRFIIEFIPANNSNYVGNTIFSAFDRINKMGIFIKNFEVGGIEVFYFNNDKQDGNIGVNKARQIVFQGASYTSAGFINGELCQMDFTIDFNTRSVVEMIVNNKTVVTSPVAKSQEYVVDRMETTITVGSMCWNTGDTVSGNSVVGYGKLSLLQIYNESGLCLANVDANGDTLVEALRNKATGELCKFKGGYPNRYAINIPI